MPRRRSIALALFVLFGATISCSPSGDTPPEAAPGVVHLDPRLADGRTMAGGFGPPRVVRSWQAVGDSPESAMAAFAPWTFENAIGLPGTPLGDAGVGIRAADYRPAEGVIHAKLRHLPELDSGDFNTVEVDLVPMQAGSLALTWRTDAPIPGVEPADLRAEAVAVGGGMETVSFDLAGHPGWRGVVRDLVLYPAWRGGQAYELRAIRLVKKSFSPGPQPGSDFGLDSGDNGLLGFSGDRRRTWVSDHGVALFDRARIPLGGRLVCEVALPGSQHGTQRAAHFAVDVRAVDVRADGEQPWRERARRSLVPGRYPQRARWRSLVADLADLAGQDVELRFRTWFGDPDQVLDDGAPEEARFWWASPMLIGEPPADRRPNVLLVTLDTLRTDFVGAYGGPDLTPFIDSLGEEGLLFEDTWSACNSTLPSHTSLLTGQAVPTHGVLDNRSTLAPDVRTLAQAMRAAGYHTAAAVSVEHLQAGWSGLGRGFDQYLDMLPGASVDGAATVGRVIEWSENWAAQGDRPVFLWVHLFDPHTPYGPPRDFLVHYVERLRAAGGEVPGSKADPPTIGQTGYTQPGKFLEGVTDKRFAEFLYQASVAYTDELVRDLVGSWQEAGRWDQTLLVLTADHGESLGEQGVWYGHQLLHTPVMKVPLILRSPGGPRGRVSARAWSPDIVRTLVKHLGLEGLDPAGVDLFGLAQAQATPNQATPDQATPDRRVWFVHSSLDQVGFRDGDIHYWHNVKEYLQLGRDRAQPAGLDFLYRHPVDPELLNNLAEVEPQLAAKFRSAMEAWMARAHSGERVRAEVSAAERARLEGLGYTGADDDGDDDGGNER
jgi:arylsulfatase A-like enzyme